MTDRSARSQRGRRSSHIEVDDAHFADLLREGTYKSSLVSSTNVKHFDGYYDNCFV